MAIPTSGQSGSITVSSTTYCVENWSLNLSNELADVTTTCSNGWVERIAVASSGQLTFSLFFDGSGITAFAPGTKFTATLNVGGPVGSSPGTQHSFGGTFIVSGQTVENPAKSVVKVNVTADSTGAITYS